MSKSWNKYELENASKIMKKNGQMSLEEFKYWVFLENLRRSGETNMFSAAPYLAKEFGLAEKEANAILIDWMKHYNSKDYQEG